MGKVHTPRSETGCSRFQRKHPTVVMSYCMVATSMKDNGDMRGELSPECRGRSTSSRVKARAGVWRAGRPRPLPSTSLHAAPPGVCNGSTKPWDLLVRSTLFQIRNRETPIKRGPAQRPHTDRPYSFGELNVNRCTVVSHPNTSRPSRRHCSSDSSLPSVVWRGECTVLVPRIKEDTSKYHGIKAHESCKTGVREGKRSELPRKKGPFCDLVDGHWQNTYPPLKCPECAFVGHYLRTECADRLVTRRVISGAAREIGSEGRWDRLSAVTGPESVPDDVSTPTPKATGWAEGLRRGRASETRGWVLRKRAAPFQFATYELQGHGGGSHRELSDNFGRTSCGPSTEGVMNEGRVTISSAHWKLRVVGVNPGSS
ncbi:hypothetical protein BC827DRAFT_1386398 [Russula dissimulans]|nr:hypothetical protein BC827DRAFT_1386398 [Russula dissimulans]